MIYTIGFVLAAAIYLVYILKKGKSISINNLIIAILLGLASWLGVVGMLIVISSEQKE